MKMLSRLNLMMVVDILIEESSKTDLDGRLHLLHVIRRFKAGMQNEHDVKLTVEFSRRTRKLCQSQVTKEMTDEMIYELENVLK